MQELYAADPSPNVGWIGGACAATTECEVDTCLAPGEGFPGGMCTTECESLCPDREEPTDTVSFCVDHGSSGTCVMRCDYDLLIDGCRRGYACEPAPRHGQSAVQSVCLPDDGSEAPPAQCFAELSIDGVEAARWELDVDNEGGTLCWVEAPLRVGPTINGVGLRYNSDATVLPVKVDCAMAKALNRFTALVAERDIVEVVHIGTYNCRYIAGTHTLSEHSFARAIDVAELVAADGTVYNVEDHWEHDTDSPETREGQFLWQLANDLFDQEIFNVILTPNYNAAHDNHLHVDLSTWGRFFE
jgi:hypothetical protein